jgi:Tfp pilus assembly protein PilO
MLLWIIEHVLSAIPQWVWPTIAIFSLSLFVLNKLLSKFPGTKIYSMFIEPVSILILLISVFIWGGSGINEIYQARIKEMQDKINIAEKQSQDVNTQLSKKQKEKIIVRKEYYATVHERIKEVEKQIDAECKLDPVVAKTLNSAAQNPNKIGNVSIKVESVK